MRKTFLLINLLIIGLAAGFSQSKHRLSFQAGVSMPLGELSQASSGTQANALEIGRSAQIQYLRKIGSSYSLLLSGFFTGNPIDHDELKSDFQQQFPEVGFRMKGGSWSSSSVLVGISKYMPIKDSRFAVEPFVSLGFTQIVKNEITVYGNTNQEFLAFGEGKSYSNSTAFQIGSLCHYSLFDRVSLTASIHYFGSQTDFGTMRQRTDFYSQASQIETFDGNTYFQLLSVQLGLSGKF